MISKTAMVPLVKEFRWKQVRDGLAEKPELIDVRDKRGRTWLHLACAVDLSTGQPSAVRDSIRLAEILLGRGIDINDAAFTEEDFRATPLWYAVAFGKNIALARFLLKRGSDPTTACLPLRITMTRESSVCWLKMAPGLIQRQKVQRRCGLQCNGAASKRQRNC
jgi:hypothetical protein